jgi:hypothetical protein
LEAVFDPILGDDLLPGLPRRDAYRVTLQAGGRGRGESMDGGSSAKQPQVEGRKEVEEGNY